MMTSPDISELLRRPAADLLAWIEALPPDVSLTTVNWLAMREVAADRAVGAAAVPETGRSRSERLIWARICESALAFAVGAGQTGEESAIDNVLAMRCRLVARIGPSDDGGSADPRVAVQLFRTGLDLGPGEARELATRWQALPATDILRLRRAKNRLGYLLWMGTALDAVLVPGDDLTQWLALRPSLP